MGLSVDMIFKSTDVPRHICDVSFCLSLPLSKLYKKLELRSVTVVFLKILISRNFI